MPSFPFPLYASPRSHSTRSALGNICIQIPHPKRCRGENDDDAGFSREFGCMGSWAGDPQASSYRVVIASTVTSLSAEPRITVCTILVVSVGTTAAYAIIKTFFLYGFNICREGIEHGYQHRLGDRHLFFFFIRRSRVSDSISYTYTFMRSSIDLRGEVPD